MHKYRLDALLCNWPFFGLLIIPIQRFTNDFQNHPNLQTLLALLFGGGWLVAMIYGFYRMAQQKWETKRVILWVLGLLWFSVISLPWLYWQYLRKESAQPSAA